MKYPILWLLKKASSIALNKEDCNDENGSKVAFPNIPIQKSFFYYNLYVITESCLIIFFTIIPVTHTVRASFIILNYNYVIPKLKF